MYADGFIPSVKGIYEHGQFSVDICLVAERDPALGRRCFAERRPCFGVGAEAKNYTTRARERERTPPSRCRLGRRRLVFTLTVIAQKFVRIRNILRTPTLPLRIIDILSREPFFAVVGVGSGRLPLSNGKGAESMFVPFAPHSDYSGSMTPDDFR